MNRRFSIFLIIEALILLFLLVALFREGIILLFGIAILLSWLAGRYKSRALSIVAAIFWFFSIFQLLGTGFFWLAIAFPVLMVYLYFRKIKSEAQTEQIFWSQETSQPREDFHSENKNEVIDLADLHFRDAGNSLAIQKSIGNTKIIVPDDVKIALDVKVKTGVVNVLNQRTEINDVNFRFFSDGYESASKRVSITIKVDSGNVEIVSA